MSDIFSPGSRHTERIEPSPGAVSWSVALTSSAKIVAVHLSFSSVPASQNVTVSVKDENGNVVRYDESDVSSTGLKEVTKVYIGWTVEISGGEILITLPNTGDTCDSVSITYEYQLDK